MGNRGSGSGDVGVSEMGWVRENSTGIVLSVVAKLYPRVILGNIIIINYRLLFHYLFL